MPQTRRILLLTAILLLAALCIPACAAMTEYGANRLEVWVYSIDGFFDLIRNDVGDETLMFRDTSPVDLPDGSIVILMNEQAVAIRCGELSRIYSIEDELLFHVFASQLVCQPVLNEGLLTEGVQVCMIAEDQPLIYADEALLEAYIEEFADAYAEE